MLVYPGQGKPYTMLPGISASTEAELLQHSLHNLGQAQLQPDRVRAPPPWGCSPQGWGCPSLPNRTVRAPHCEGSSQRYGEGCWPCKDQLLYQFPSILASIMLLNTIDTKPFYSPIIALLFPTLPAPYGMRSAAQTDC